ncbi:phenylalanine--tRNA ligase beta subunit, cytoplasmic [Neltuma alba]|uniref:phenylalanine--tRNA ligase beta subunit, cytoplasmic n=1 Tax=Neltuma alba TaxID=207710 RepID=UPI0010A55025|nr:phenylalanine--tRNA ligase beta subunit, cytoplasmic-like [Prosopis alba]XP_028772642.1 phenylalanine--tRNA ligase beta subunit, cytoplasmic-like [Prosopis alba]
MPTIGVGRDRLFAALGRTYTQEEFEDLCFSFGIELDDVTTEKAIVRKEKHLEEEVDEGEEVIYKIEVPANRYDLLCLEGLAQALRVFCGVQEIPTYSLADISKDAMLKMHVKPETSLIRPYIVCAILRGVTFDQARYNSFIDLQDKLHQNICRRRTLVAIGTHDLDKLEGPFTYEALPPSSINFVPLKQEKNFRADELMEFYKSDLKLKKFLHIIEGSPVFPVIYDSKRTVLSLPPIINGARSAITLETKNVFIECTATDLTKAKIVLNTMVTAFSEYCEKKFVIEPVEVISSDGKSCIYPDLSIYNMEVSLSYITGLIGVSLEMEEVTGLLNRMQLLAKQSVADNKQGNIVVSVPPSRSDVLHPCDVMEDVAIAYGFNAIKDKAIIDNKGSKRLAASLRLLPLNELSDLIRKEVAMMGFTEVLTFILCSSKENFGMLNRKDDETISVVIGNPRSSDFEAVRTSLMPGILKTVAHNKDHPKPIKIFEVGDIVVLDDTKDVGARNQRQLAALYCGSNAGFEIVHGLVDRVMEKNGVPFVSPGDRTGYYIVRSDEPEFLAGRQAKIVYKGHHIGTFGIVHPEVLSNFDIPDPCSFAELNIESFL